MKKKTIKIIAISVALLFVVVIIFAKVKHISPLSWGIHNPVNQAVFSDAAINGYDPVAYFTVQKTVKGDSKYTYNWNGATWYFASNEHLNLFKNNPEKYAPQFGGYCAFAASKGFTANTDPNAFAIIDDKLYLCSEQKFLDEWMQGGSESMQKAQKNWE